MQIVTVSQSTHFAGQSCPRNLNLIQNIKREAQKNNDTLRKSLIGIGLNLMTLAAFQPICRTTRWYCLPAKKHKFYCMLHKFYYVFFTQYCHLNVLFTHF